MIVSFSGNDGSGKTTIAQKVESSLKKAGFPVIYREEYTYFLLKYLFLLIPRSLRKKKRSEFVDPENTKKSFLSRIWSFIVWVDCFLEQIYLRLRYRKKVLILDRYPYDFLMTFEYLGVSNSVVRFLFMLIPKAHISFVLVADPHMAHERKKHDHSNHISFYVLQRDRYIALANKKKMNIIDTSKSIDETMDLVWKHWTNAIHPYSKHKTFFKYCINNVLEDYKRLNTVQKEAILEQHKKAVRTIQLLKNVCEKHNCKYAIIKTYNPFNTPLTDIDIIVEKNKYETIKQEISKTCDGKKGFAHKAETFTEDSLLPIDLHYEVSWHNVQLFKDTDILEKTITRTLYDEHISVPDSETELLIWMGHSLMQHHYTTMGEFKIMISLLHDINALKHKYWSKSEYKWLLKKVITIHSLWYPYKPLQNFEHKTMLVQGNDDFVFWHHPKTLRINSMPQFLDYFLYFYRFLRYKLNGTLPYNTCWINETISS